MIKRYCVVFMMVIINTVLYSHQDPILLTPYQSLDLNNFEQVENELRSPYQLYNYIRYEFKYQTPARFTNNTIWYWQPAKDMFYRKSGQCTDYADFCLAVLTYHGINAIWYSGVYGSSGHAVVLFYWKGMWHDISNTEDVYNEFNGTVKDIDVVASNYGFTGRFQWVYTNSVPQNRLTYSALEESQSKWANMDRVMAQQYVSAVKFYGNQKLNFDYSFSPYIWNKNKMSLAIMYRPFNDWLKFGVSYSAHGYYLDMFNPVEFAAMNHVLWVHSCFANRIGVSAYYDVSQGLYKGIDADVKILDWSGSLFNGQVNKIECYMAFRNGFQVVDGDFRIWWSKQLYTYIQKRDQHFMGQLYYELKDRTKIKTRYTMTNISMSADPSNYSQIIYTTNISYDFRSPDINTFITPGLYLDTDFNLGFFLQSHIFTAWLYIYNVNFDFPNDKTIFDNFKDTMIFVFTTIINVRLSVSYRF